MLLLLHFRIEPVVILRHNRTWASQEHLLVFFFNARFGADETDPFFRIVAAQVIVSRGGEESKDILLLVLRVLEAGDGRQVGEIDLVAKAGIIVALVDGKEVGTENEVNTLPGLEQGQRRRTESRPDQCTFVFRVRFLTGPLFRTRSNSKLPF
jgi:hypothetical protein